VSSPERFTLALIGASLLSMVVFAFVSRRRPRDADVARRPTTVLLGYWVRDWLMWVLSPLERALIGGRVPPVALNLAGVAFGLAAGIGYARSALAAAGWLVVLGGLADILDGRIARARNLVSVQGAFLDSTLDRFAETFAYMGLILYFRESAVGGLVTLGALGGSLLVSYARARGEAHGVSCSGGAMPRAELLVLASLLDAPAAAAWGFRPGTLLTWALGLIAVGSIGTAAYRTLTIARSLAPRPPVDGPGAKE
jgi:phosphatidylglycerophosphate synthase